MIDSTAALVTTYLRKHHIHLELLPAEDLPPVLGAPRELGQVLMNLVNNALEAMTDMEADSGSRRVVIRTAREGETVVVTVSDNGPGIDAQNIGRLFEPFFSRRKSMGMGVGLSVCYTIVSDHGGSIEADNLENGGAVFTLSFPIMVPQENSRAG